MRIKSVRRVEPVPSRCIEVDSGDRLFASGGENGASIVSHNSVAQRNIIFRCIMAPDHWRLLGIDLKKVELSVFRAYSNVVLGIATELEDALTVLRFASQTMLKRYAEMEQLGVNNFLDLPEQGQALLVMVDEMGELLSPSGVKALRGDTIIPTPAGYRKLSEITVGDTVYDNTGVETTVHTKYEPLKQTQYKLAIKQDETESSEEFISGSEHYWVAYFQYPNGEIRGPETVTTEFLYNFRREQANVPDDQKVRIKFKRG